MIRTSFFFAPCVLLVIGLAAACASSSEDGSENHTDKCCPISPPPTSCNEVQMGGSRRLNPTCGWTYDNIPPLRRTTDEDGCPTYQGGAPGQPSEEVPYRYDCPKRDDSGVPVTDAGTE